jgi:uncharacterized surface protein with fasciclin (FAS1) repeats
MTFPKATLTVGTILALGLSAGAAGPAAAGGGCDNQTSAQGYSHNGKMASAMAYRTGTAPHYWYGMHPMGAHPAMYWGDRAVKVTTISTSEPAEDAPGDIVDVAVAAGDFDTLATALQAAELVDTLKGEGPFTVFAPTDAAFAKIPQDKLKALLEDKEALTAVLTYHVVPGKVLAADVVELESAETVQGSSITIDTSDGVKVDDATVIKTDVMASNGVIHVIDTVIIPK